MRGSGYITIVLLACSVFAGLQIYKNVVDRRKFDLDVCMVVEKGEYTENATHVNVKGYSSFEKSICRVYHIGRMGRAVLHFLSQDQSDVDYIVPYECVSLTSIGNSPDVLYNGRVYKNKRDYRIYSYSDSNNATFGALVQLIQPPPAKDYFVFMDMAQFLQAIAIFAAILMYFFESYKERSIAQRDSYMKIESEAINVFRFEFDNAKRIHWIYDENSVAIRDNQSRWACQEYICQILNLFEIVVERKSEHTLAIKIYKTWIRWFWDVGSAPHFPDFWNDVKENYTEGLNHRIDAAVAVSQRIRTEWKNNPDPQSALEEKLCVEGWHEYQEEVRKLDSVYERAKLRFRRLTTPPRPAP